MTSTGEVLMADFDAPAANGFDYESEVRSYCRSFTTTFTTAQGSFISDDKGRQYIDFLSGCSALNYGHNDPTISEALVNYIRTGGVAHGLDMKTEAKQAFLDAFVNVILKPRGMDYRIQFPGPTGSNSVEAAMKLARKVTGRSQIIAFTNGFHGVTAGALAATGNQHHRMGPTIQLPGVQRALFDGYLGPDIDTAEMLDQLLSDPSSGFDEPAAVLFETVQGEGGLNVASADWIRSISAVARKHGALVIIDDIQAGCGRTGTFFSFENMGIEPDIVTLSKSLSGYGLPLALVLIHPDHDRWTPAEHNGTFRGNNLAFVSAATAINKFWQGDALQRDVKRRAKLLHDSLNDIRSLIPGARLKGRGMMIGIDVKAGELAGAVCREAFNRGLIIETSGANDEVIKTLAPLTTPDDVLEAGLKKLLEATQVVTTKSLSTPIPATVA